MAFVLVESLAHNKGKLVQIVIKALEILFLSAGFISIVFMFKEAEIPTFPQTLVEFCNSFLSSSLCMIAAINFVILLIVISSRFHHHHLVDEHDHDVADVENHDREVSKSPTVVPSESPTVVSSKSPAIILSELPTVVPSQHNKKIESTTKNDEKNSEEEYEDTNPIDATWQAITRGGKDKQKPKRGQVMKKSETWDAVRRQRAVVSSESPAIILSELPAVVPSQHNKKIESTTKNDEKNSEEECEDTSTMDATWQAITRGGKDKQKPKREQVMKKSEKWDAVRRRRAVVSSESPTIILSELPTVVPSQHNKKIESTTKNDEKNSEEEYEDTNTIDATWQAITREGKDKQKPKREKVMKKSETWDAVRRRRAAGVQRVDSEELFASRSSYCAWKELRKSETFNDAVSIMRRGGLQRDSIMSLDELNNKVEAFIKTFNDNMRLQRQESYQRFLDMINNRHL